LLLLLLPLLLLQLILLLLLLLLPLPLCCYYYYCYCCFSFDVQFRQNFTWSRWFHNKKNGGNAVLVISFFLLRKRYIRYGRSQMVVNKMASFNCKVCSIECHHSSNLQPCGQKRK
jgi:hypothetical protein